MKETEWIRYIWVCGDHEELVEFIDNYVPVKINVLRYRPGKVNMIPFAFRLCVVLPSCYKHLEYVLQDFKKEDIVLWKGKN